MHGPHQGAGRAAPSDRATGTGVQRPFTTHARVTLLGARRGSVRRRWRAQPQPVHAVGIPTPTRPEHFVVARRREGAGAYRVHSRQTPVTGRIFFEHVIRDNLDLGRADRVGLIFGRQIRRRGPRPTPGRFRTRVITAGVTPSLHADYRVTDHGLGTAMLITRVHDRLLPTALSHQTDTATGHRLRAASTAYQRALEIIHRAPRARSSAASRKPRA